MKRDALAEGIYEHLLTVGLERRLEGTAPARTEVSALSRADLPAKLARHLAAEIERALRDAKDVDAQLELGAAILETVARLAPDVGADEARLVPPPQTLLSVHRASPPVRPASPLSSTTLLTRARSEPALGSELSREIASADGVDILAAFVTKGGVRAVWSELERAARRGARVRVLTTVFTGTTERAALDALARLPEAEVRVSFDVRRTRLHAKAWLFRRAHQLSTAYVGSANLTATALGAGHEWMVKASAGDLPHVIDKFEGTFESLWNDDEFERYDPDSEACVGRLLAALRAERATSNVTVLSALAPRALPFQVEILDLLEAERSLRGHTRNLVVAATGTGKTVIAAFDYQRRAAKLGVRPRLLFLAHRKEILEQAQATFRHVLGDAAFGELFVDGREPAEWDHVFASVQSAARGLPERVSREHFRHVVLDECHHLPADSYQALSKYLSPEVLVGLTATPERADGRSLLPDFDDRVAVELRLWHALERQLLVPFEYYGVSDGTDLADVRWSRQGYSVDALSKLYTGNDARLDLVVRELERRVVDVRKVRALAFCVSVEHAEFTARGLEARGIPAAAVHGKTGDEERARVRRRLERGEIAVVCACDLYNEGVDLPFVDVLLFLRPTTSATLFLQQLGRGLRLHPDKTSCLVLDFVGQHRAEFRFESLYSAMTGVPRARLRRAVEEGFPFLPSGSVLQLDRVVRDQVLASLKRAVATSASLARDVRELALNEPNLTLAKFLETTGRDLDDVYERGDGWTTLRAAAGVLAEPGEAARDLSRRLGWLRHVDDPHRLRSWRELPTDADSDDETYVRRMAMLAFQLEHRGTVRDARQTVAWLRSTPGIADELRELSDVLTDRIPLANDVHPVPEWPLALHRHYTRREIVAAVGFVVPGKKGVTPQGGILKLPGARELLLVTLDKSASSFSPTTRYRDYAISPSLFHWETQSAASVVRPSGRRYLDSPSNGWSFHLFVRADPESPYAFLGPVRLRSASGDRPIGITWELETPMPAALFDRFATLVQT